MMRRPSILNAVLVAVILGAAGAAVFVWRQQQRTALLLRSLPDIPDLSRWPEEFSRQIREATLAAKQSKDPAVPFGRLACLYLANGYLNESSQTLRALRELEPANARWAYLLGEANLRSGDTNAAEKAAEAVARLDPGYVPAWLRLAYLRRQRGAAAEERECYARAVAQAPTDVMASYLLMHFDAVNGRAAEVRGPLAELTQAHPEIKSLHELLAGVDAAIGDAAGSAKEHSLQARAKFQLPNGDPWIEDLSQFSFNPENPRGLARRAANEGRFETADKLVKRALELPKVDSESLSEFSHMYEFMGRTNDSLHVLEQGVVRCPDEPILRMELSRVLVSMGRKDEAIGLLRKALERWPGEAMLHCALGYTFCNTGSPEMAEPELREALRLDSTLADAHGILGACLIDLGKRTEGRASLEKALAIRPDYKPTLLLLGKTALQDGELAAAEPPVRHLLALAPDDPAAQRLFWLMQGKKGAAAEKEGKLEEAEASYNAGLELVPECTPLLRAKGLLKLRLDRPEEAIAAFQSCVRIEPKQPEGYLLLGWALQKAGRATKARDVLQAGLGLAEPSGNADLIQGFKQLLGQ